MFRNALLAFVLIFYALDPVFSLEGIGRIQAKEEFYGDRDGSMNAVLFLPQPEHCLNNQKDIAMSFLNLSLLGKIQPCTSRLESSLPPTMESLMRQTSNRRCDCKKLLESSILSFVDWARKDKRMAAAIVSLNSQQKDDKKGDSLNYFDYKLEIIDPPLHRDNPFREPVSEHFSSINNPNMHTMQGFQQMRLPPARPDRIQASSLPILIQDTGMPNQQIPIYNTYFKSMPQLPFNDIHKYRRNKFKDLVNVHRIKRKFIIEPENTEIINIQSLINDEPNEILDVPALKRSERPDSIWDILGIMSAIRKSFFVNLFNPVLDPQQRIMDEENGMNFNSLGQIRTPSLFHLVKRTLHRLQREAVDKNASGYVLIVFGGHLCQIADPYSDLVQSIKHVRETTNPERTLLVVTSSCPLNLTSDIKRSSDLIPLYASGPNYELLSKARELYDVPVQMSEALKSNLESTEDPIHKNRNNFITNDKYSGILNVASADLNNNPNDATKDWLENLQGTYEITRRSSVVDDASREKRNVRGWLPELIAASQNKAVDIILNKFLLFNFTLLFLFLIIV